MLLTLKDIVFQNDRYFLLLDENLMFFSKKGNSCQIYIDNEKYCDLTDAEISEILIIPDKTVLESKQNLNELERIFRKTRSVKIHIQESNV